jgi:PKD repeat protein
MEINFEIFDPNANQTTQANFESEEQPENELKIHFKDRSTGYVIKAWNWDFGDGNFSDIQDPVHEYAEPGVYDVSLIISSKPEGSGTQHTSKITKRVLVGLADYYTLGGHVYAGSFPIDYGAAYLYSLEDPGNPVPVDTADIDVYGYYYFYAVLEGSYMVKARLMHNSEKYGEYIPTYYGYSFNWEDASPIILDKEIFNAHVYLIESDGTKQGAGTINGQILYDTNSITKTYAPAEDIEIILMDGEDICLTCKLSDLEGNFRFQDIKYGTYQLYPEVTGIHNEPMYITISADIPGNDELFNVIIQSEQIFLGITDPASEIFEGDIVFSPNPFRGKGQLSLELKTSGSYTIMSIDMKGSVISQQSYSLDRGHHVLPVDLSAQPAGLYHIVIQGTDGSLTPVKVVKQ